MKDQTNKPFQLALFFTRGVSLRVWDDVGMFEREVLLYRKMAEQGIRVLFVTYGDANDLRYANRLPGIKILCNRFGLTPERYERWLPYLFAPWLLRSDIFKTNQMNGADVALRTARIFRKPLATRCGYMWSEFIAREQGTDSEPAVRARELEFKTFSGSRRIVVTTPLMRDSVLERLPEMSASVKVVPNYVNTEIFHPARLPNPDYDCLFVGRLAPQKNVQSLLEAVQNTGQKLTLIGSGHLKDDLKARYPDENIQWFANVPNSELPQYMQRARLFILPSHYEGHPKSLIEAMACGLAVIGADSPGIREMIRHGETGWLCGVDSESIQAAIQKLLADPNLCVQLGRNARQYVVDNFSLDKILSTESKIYREILNEKP